MYGRCCTYAIIDISALSELWKGVRARPQSASLRGCGSQTLGFGRAEKPLATTEFCRQWLLATHRVAQEASHKTRCVRRSHTHRWIPVPSTTVLSRRMNAQNRTPTCPSPSSGAYTWRKPFPYPLWTGWNRQLQCHANDMACARWTSTGKARSVYHDATPRFQIVKRVILRIRCCHLQQSGRSQYFHACRC